MILKQVEYLWFIFSVENAYIQLRDSSKGAVFVSPMISLSPIALPPLKMPLDRAAAKKSFHSFSCVGDLVFPWISTIYWFIVFSAYRPSN